MSFDHAAWVAAWGRNALVFARYDYRLPELPEGRSWAVLRHLERGQRAVRLSILDTENPETELAWACTDPDYRSVATHADELLKRISS